MYSGSISLAISAKLLTVNSLTRELSADHEKNAFMERRKLIAFKYLCELNSELAVSLIKGNQIRYRVWMIVTNESLDDISFESKVAKIIMGKHQGALETELIPYYVEAGNELETLLPNLMILETCVDVDRISDLLRYLPMLDISQKRLVVIRMITRFCHLKEIWPKYWIQCMYEQYLDLFRRILSEPEILNFLQIQRLQSATDHRLLGFQIVDRYQLLLYRCNQCTITRILGLPSCSEIDVIRISVHLLRTLGVDEYYRQLHEYYRLRTPESINKQNLYFMNFWEYHPDDQVMINNYLFTGPEFNYLLTSLKNPYTFEPILPQDLQRIRLKIPQPEETMKELCEKYLQ